MSIHSGLAMSGDGTVSSCGELDRSLLLRDLRKAKPGTPESDLLVMARVAHDVLVLDPMAHRLPLFAEGKSSLYKKMVLAARQDDAGAFFDAGDDDVLLSSNVARFVLDIPQQTGKASTVVFVKGPGGRVPLRSRGSAARV